MKENNILLEKALLFAARIVKLHNYLISKKQETVISKQIIRSATSIGANANEAIYGISKPDFISKLHISLKETVTKIFHSIRHILKYNKKYCNK